MILRVIPLLIPQFVVLIPSFVFLEASLAVIGLGDPVLPTWGKVIEDAYANGALFEGQYYWVVEYHSLIKILGIVCYNYRSFYETLELSFCSITPETLTMGSLAKIKVAIIGAGSSYTPEIVEGLVQAREKLPVGEIVLMDIDVERLATLTSFCQRFIRHLGCKDIRLTRESEIREAIQDARFIVTQLRVGGNQQRILDEKIPLKYGLIGQETTGPGGC